MKALYVCVLHHLFANQQASLTVRTSALCLSISLYIIHFHSLTLTLSLSHTQTPTPTGVDVGGRKCSLHPHLHL